MQILSGDFSLVTVIVLHFFLFNWPVVPELVWIGLGTNEIY